MIPIRTPRPFVDEPVEPPPLPVTSATLPNVSVLVVPPAIEPFTVEEAKLRAGLVWTPGDPRDVMIEDFVKAARERVERDTGTALLTQTREVYLAHYVTPAEFPSPARPIQSVDAIASPDPALYPWAFSIVVGWLTVGEIPPSLRYAVGLLLSHYATAGRDAVVMGLLSPMPLGYEDAIADWKRVSV